MNPSFRGRYCKGLFECPCCQLLAWAWVFSNPHAINYWRGHRSSRILTLGLGSLEYLCRHPAHSINPWASVFSNTYPSSYSISPLSVNHYGLWGTTMAYRELLRPTGIYYHPWGTTTDYGELLSTTGNYCQSSPITTDFGYLLRISLNYYLFRGPTTDFGKLLRISVRYCLFP
jgi:hypothetical protein